MKELIEAYLIKCGFTNITWRIGREGYFILGQQYDSTFCVDLHDIVNEMLRNEKIK